MTRATITARVESALRAEHTKLCGYMLDESLDPKHRDLAGGNTFLRTISARLDQIEAQLANLDPVVDRVIAALESA